jgi:hypothetical protein
MWGVRASSLVEVLEEEERPHTGVKHNGGEASHAIDARGNGVAAIAGPQKRCTCREARQRQCPKVSWNEKE